MANESKNSPRKPVIIKKYENRRLYNSTDSRYVNLDEVAQMVRSGYDVRVLDAATGEDLTRLILTQIIVEHAKEPDSAFPLDMLRQMVVASGRVTQESTLKYMKALFDMYQNAFRAMTPPLNPFEYMPRPVVPAATSTEPQAPYVPKYPGADDDAQSRADLRQRLEELEGIVARFKKKRKPPGKKKKKKGRRS